MQEAIVTATALVRARAGDREAFRELTEPYRRELQLHCYRMLGSVQDAEDTLQETLLAAWRGLDRFEERASVRTWLYKIATNQCLNALRGRRPPPRGRGHDPVVRSPAGAHPPDRAAVAAALPGRAARRPARHRAQARKHATSAGRRWPWRSWPGCSACRPGSAPSWCCATCSAIPRRRPPGCSLSARCR